MSSASYDHSRRLFVLVALLGAFALSASPASAQQGAPPQTATQTAKVEDAQAGAVVTRFYVVRHAEKESEAGNAGLSDIGKQRAKDLRDLLKDKQIAAIYHTNTRRTKETAMPLGEELELALNVFDPPAPGEAAKTWTQGLIANNAGKNVLIIAHSGKATDRGSVPSLASALAGGAEAKDLADEYFHLYVVTLKTVNGQEQPPTIEYEKYGKAPDGQTSGGPNPR